MAIVPFQTNYNLYVRYYNVETKRVVATSLCGHHIYLGEAPHHNHFATTAAVPVHRFLRSMCELRTHRRFHYFNTKIMICAGHVRASLIGFSFTSALRLVKKLSLKNTHITQYVTSFFFVFTFFFVVLFKRRNNWPNIQIATSIRRRANNNPKRDFHDT